MKLQVLHRTHFKYGQPVRDSFNEARLQPTEDHRQLPQSFLLKVLPSTRLSHYRDFYQNYVHRFELGEAHPDLTVTATSVVTTRNGLALANDAPTAPISALASTATDSRCYDFLQSSQHVETSAEAWRLALDLAGDETDTWQLAQRLMHAIFRDFQYQPDSTHIHTTTQEILRNRQGVCQDFAHVMLSLCRSTKIPARYVSGYLYNGPADSLKGAQASHAWVEVYVPAHGWIGLDPTNGQQVDGRYVKIGVGRDYGDVTPLKGTYRGTTERKMSVNVLVTMLDEHAEPKPLKPAS